MLKVGLSLFLSGIFLGAGPCLASCGPFLVSFIAGNKKDVKSSIGIWLAFSLSRVFAYLVLGILAGIVSKELVSRSYEQIFAKNIFIFGGIFVSIIGVLMLFNKDTHFKLCRIFQEKLIQKDTKSIILFGLIVGFLPCAPLLGVLTYIALISASIFKAVFYSLSFGIGTLISPLIVMVICASFISRLLSSQERVYAAFQKICGIIIILLGLQLVYRGFNI